LEPISLRSLSRKPPFQSSAPPLAAVPHPDDAFAFGMELARQQGV